MLDNTPPLAPPLRRVHPRVGPYSKYGALALLDGRSREAQYMKRKRAELTAHVGSPSAVQRQMIERAVRLSLQLELMDERLTHEAWFMTPVQDDYLNFSNALTRVLARLGLEAVATPPPAVSAQAKSADEDFTKLSPQEAYFRMLHARAFSPKRES